MAKTKKSKKPKTKAAERDAKADQEPEDAGAEAAEEAGAETAAEDGAVASPLSDADTGPLSPEGYAEEDTSENFLPPEDPTLVETANVIDLDRAREEAQSEEPLRLEMEGEGGKAVVPFEQLEPLLESLLFASDKTLTLADLKRLTGERDTRLLTQALESLQEKRAQSGVQVVAVAGGWSLRTNPAFSDWVGKLLAGRPVRLSRAMLETLSIIAYRQPITRPEIDEIRGVDCGPVLKTLLDRGLIRVIGKKEEVGRPMLYGTTSEFLRVFSLKDLTELPTLRQFHELSAEHQAKVNEALGEAAASEAPPAEGSLEPLAAAPFAAESGEDDTLLEDLEDASAAASRAAGPLAPEPEVPPEAAPDEGPPSR